jgi:arsenate reductase
MAELTVYEKPTCTTCRNLSTLLTERGIDFDEVDYHVTGLTEDELRDVLGKAGLEPRDVLRPKEAKAAGLTPDDVDFRTYVEHPELLQRPLVVRGDRAVLARPPERVLELLD